MIHSLRSKVLILVGGGLLLAMICLAWLAETGMRSIIDRSQEAVYQNRLNHLLITLSQYENELRRTLQVEAYRDQFQDEALRVIRSSHLADASEDVYPFIIDRKGEVLLHPNLARGDRSLAALPFVKRMLQGERGSFSYRYLSDDKWLVFANFPAWDWVVAYSLREPFKYADLNHFHKKLLPGLIGILLVVTVILIYGLQRFLQPILSLTNSADLIAKGDLAAYIDTEGNDEVSSLARGFESMRDAVRKTIQDLDHQRQELEIEVQERRRAENSAMVAEGRLRAILSSAADPLLVTDLKHEIVLLNQAAEKAFPQAKVGMFLGAVMADSSLEEAILLLTQSEQEQLHVEWSGKHAEGTSCVYNAHSAKILDSAGHPMGVVTLLRDVTKARELDQLKREFLATTAHELRTPLAVIQGFAELLQDRPDTPLAEKEEFLSIILQRCSDLENLIDDLHDVSRIESGQGLKLNLQTFDLVDLVEKNTTQYQSSSNNQTCQLFVGDRPLMVSGDWGKIQRVLDNLMSNASKFSPPKSLIEVVCEKRDGMAWVRVKDHGGGISSEKQALIFEKFYRIDGSNTAPQGLGLGLFIVKNIISKHGGRIELESQVDQGTTFAFGLPLAGDKKAVSHA